MEGQTPTPKGRTTWAGETHRGLGLPYSVVQLGTGDGSPPPRAGGGGAGLEECHGQGGWLQPGKQGWGCPWGQPRPRQGAVGPAKPWQAEAGLPSWKLL